MADDKIDTRATKINVRRCENYYVLLLLYQYCIM